MTIARACRPPAQESCRRLAGRWWISQHPPRPPITTASSVISTRTSGFDHPCDVPTTLPWEGAFTPGGGAGSVDRVEGFRSAVRYSGGVPCLAVRRAWRISPRYCQETIRYRIRPMPPTTAPTRPQKPGMKPVPVR